MLFCTYCGISCLCLICLFIIHQKSLYSTRLPLAAHSTTKVSFGIHMKNEATLTTTITCKGFSFVDVFLIVCTKLCTVLLKAVSVKLDGLYTHPDI